MVHVVDRSGSRAQTAEFEEPEDDQDPRTVLLPSAAAITSAAALAVKPAESEPIPPEASSPQMLVPLKTKLTFRGRGDWVAKVTTAAGVAVVIAFLVVVAIVGMVGGLGIGIAIANVIG